VGNEEIIPHPQHSIPNPPPIHAFMLLLASLLLLFFSNAPGISAFVDVPSVAKTPAVASLIMLLPVCHVPGLSAVVGLT
jgi:hypothetical protein